MFVFESGSWINVGEVSFELKEPYVAVRSFGLVDCKRIKNAWVNPSIIKNKITKNEKTFWATPIIMTKYIPYNWNTRKNNKNLKYNNKLEIAVMKRNGFPLIN